MRHKFREEQGDPGGDSFLDVVSNIVGILIILVMVVGAKIKETPVELNETTTVATKDDQKQPDQPLNVQAERRKANAMIDSVNRMRQQLVNVQTVSLATEKAAQELATIIELGKRELNVQKNKLGKKQQRELEISQQLAEDQKKLDKLQLELIQTVAQEPEEVKVKSYPTPISKSVYTKEEHYRLLEGRIVRIPFSELQQALIGEKRQLIWKLRDLPEVSGMIGPIDGFRLRYHFQRRLTGASLTQATFRAISHNLGEPLEKALQRGSKLQKALASVDPRYTTITVWTYPDSFKEFRKLKKELYGRGFAVAARPIPQGGPIGFSPTGTHSTAQ